MARYDIVPDKNSDANRPWKLKRSRRVVSRHRTQQMAINASRRKGRSGDNVYVHGSDGRIRKEFTIQ